MLACKDLKLMRGSFTLRGSFKVAPGERLALFAPSGSGKSTLLEAVSGFLAPEEGRIFLQGEDITDLPVERRPLSYLFQEANLLEHLTVFQNAALGIGGKCLSAREKERVRHMLASFELEKFHGRRASCLSGGQKQRVALARCLLQERPLLLLDEPFNGLDEATKEILFGALRALTQTALIFTTHNPMDLEKLATHTMTLRAGCITSL